jgi:hypothetical protein
MPWFKVDDGFHGHPKVMDLSLAAVGLWTLAGTWCANYLTDGEIPLKVVQRLGGTKKQAKELVQCGLWSEKSGDLYQFCDWNDYQPTKETVEAERSRARERMNELRAKRKGTAKGEPPESSGQTEDVRPNNSRTEGERSDEPDPNERGTTVECSEEVRVAPTQPLSPIPIPSPLKEEKTSSPTTSADDDPKPVTYPPAFEAFWDAYPRKVGKKAALAAFNKARKIATVQQICTGAGRYADDPNREDTFTAHPTTWLNEGRWDDDPLPDRNAITTPARPTGAQTRAQAGLARLAAYDAQQSPRQLELGA